MGSFNTTCFASMQTIASGDECFIFPIMADCGYNKIQLSRGEEKTEVYGVSNSTCYANAFWNCAGRLISAKYDDYGRVEVDDTDRNKRIIKEMFANVKRDFYKTEEGENKSHDVPFDPATIDLSDPIKAIDDMWEASQHEYRVFTRNYLGVPVQYVFAIISKAAADYLFNMVNNNKGWNDKPLHVENKIAQIEEDYKSFADLGKLGVTHFLFKINSYFDGGEGYRSFHHWYLTDIIEEQKDKNYLTDITKDLLRDLYYDKYVFAGLEWFNIKIMPMVYASQDYSNDIGKGYAKFVKSVSKTITDIRKDRY